MKRALPLLIVLTLPLMAFAGDPTAPLVPTVTSGEPVPVTKSGDPLGYTVIPLGEVRVISLDEMMKTGGLISSENFPGAKSSKKKKKKKRLSAPVGAAAAGLFGAALDSSRSWGESGAALSSTLDVRTPALPGSTVTRAAVSPEPGSALLCLLALPAAVGYFRTRSKNA